MSDDLFEKKAEFISWCIEMYANANSENARDVANEFANKKVLDFLGEGWVYIYQMMK